MNYHHNKIIADARLTELMQQAQTDALVKVTRQSQVDPMPVYAPLLSRIGAAMMAAGQHLHERYTVATEAASTAAQDIRATSTSEFPCVESPA